MILVTGVTGHLGGAAAEQLVRHLPPHELSILARGAEKAKPFADRAGVI